MSRHTRTLIRLGLMLPLASGLLLGASSDAWAEDADDRPVLELSMEEAIEMAMENNVDLAVERYAPEEAEWSITQAEGFYDPNVSSFLLWNDGTAPRRDEFSGGDEVSTKTAIFNFGASQRFRTGGQLSLAFDNRKQDTDSIFSTFNPSFTSDLSFSLSQPLLRDRAIDAGRNQIRVAKKNKAISDVQFRAVVINLRANVQALYYNVMAAIRNLEVAKQSLALAEKLLEENRIKVRVGTLAPLDVVEAESEAAAREEEVIRAEGLLGDAEDALRQAISPEYDTNVWAARIVPTTKFEPAPPQIEVEKALERALEERTDLKAARMGIESASYQLELANNQKLPSLDLIASYAGAGVGGTQLIRDGLGGTVIEEIEGGYKDAASDALKFTYPTWYVGVQFSMPIRNREAKAVAARASLARDQRRASVRSLELQVATEVRAAGRAVDTNFKRVESARAARVLAEKRLDAEEKKFAAGMSTSFLVTQAQRDLTSAAVLQLDATLEYAKSLITFERAQEAGVGGGGGTLSVNAGGLQGLLAGSGSSTQVSGTGAPSPN